MRRVRTLSLLAVAATALAAPAAIAPAAAQSAPCGTYTGNICVEVEVCVGFGLYACKTTVISRYRPAAKF